MNEQHVIAAWNPDWMRKVKLPWVTLVVATGGNVLTFWHFGRLLRVWVGYEGGHPWLLRVPFR